MAGAFLSEALRKEALAQVRGQMLQSEITRNTAQTLMGRVAPQLIGADLQREFATGKARQQGAERKMRRDVGTTQLEMRKKLWFKEKIMGLIANVAEATGALGATMVGPDLEAGLPEAEMPTAEEVRADPTRRLAQRTLHPVTAPGVGPTARGEAGLDSGGAVVDGQYLSAQQQLEDAGLDVGKLRKELMAAQGGELLPEPSRGEALADVLEKAKYSEQIAGIPLERELSEAAGEYGGKEPIYGAFKEPVDTRVGYQKPAADRGDLDAVDEDDWDEYEQEKINRALAARLLEMGPR